jgi:hypothetical protein
MVNQMLGALSLEKHPDKTFIGKIERGFDFLGYHFSPAGLKVAKKTIANFIEKASRLYEQKRRTVSAVSPLAMYNGDSGSKQDCFVRPNSRFPTQ